MGPTKNCNKNETKKLILIHFGMNTKQNTDIHQKKAVQFWSFIKEESSQNIKFKTAQCAFDRISKERKVSMSEVEGGASFDNLTDFILARHGSDNDIALKLKITKMTSSEQLDAIKIKFVELLQCFRSTICDDPRSALHFYHFINDRTKYKVSHCDVQFVYEYALKNEWFEPMQRKYKKNKIKIYKEQSDEGSDDQHSDEGMAEFELVKKEEKNKKNDNAKTVCYDAMNDNDFDKILKKYAASYDNKPKNAAQIQKFAKENGQNYKWKAVRIAFSRWIEFRGGNMPNNKD